MRQHDTHTRDLMHAPTRLPCARTLRLPLAQLKTQEQRKRRESARGRRQWTSAGLPHRPPPHQVASRPTTAFDTASSAVGRPQEQDGAGEDRKREMSPNERAELAVAAGNSRVPARAKGAGGGVLVDGLELDDALSSSEDEVGCSAAPKRAARGGAPRKWPSAEALSRQPQWPAYSASTFCVPDDDGECSGSACADADAVGQDVGEGRAEGPQDLPPWFR
jgi:hypothetical protein